MDHTMRRWHSIFPTPSDTLQPSLHQGRKTNVYRKRSPCLKDAEPRQEWQQHGRPTWQGQGYGPFNWSLLSFWLSGAHSCSGSGLCMSLSPSVFLILLYSGSQQLICIKPGLNYHPLPNLPLQISSINAINGRVAGFHQSPVAPIQHWLPSTVAPKSSSLCMWTALHTIYTCTCQNKADVLPTQEALSKTQFNEDMYVRISVNMYGPPRMCQALLQTRGTAAYNPKPLFSWTLECNARRVDNNQIKHTLTR